MNTLRCCPKCGAIIPASVGGSVCGGCMLRLGVELEQEPEEATEADLGALTRRQVTVVGVQFHHLGGYEFEEELARGGMGMVFRAWHRELQRHVALKLMLPDQLDSTERVRRFKLEAEATARLEHPNIVPIYEIGEIEGQHFLCMKLIQGETLGHTLAKGRFGPRRACEFMATLADAVHYAHQRGVLHRDLKPGNVLVDQQGQPQVTDFGLARLLESDQELTRTDAVLGTPGYMSPEQAAGRSKDLTTASDIHALGAILYEMLTGQPPFRAATVLETLRLVRDCEVVPPRALDPAVPLDLDTICRKCLNKEPGERYATAQVLAEDLRRFLRNEPVLARPLTPLARTVRWCRRHAGATALVAGILTLLVLFTGAALFQRKRMLRDKQTFAGFVASEVEADLAAIGTRVESEAAVLRSLLLSRTDAGESQLFSYTNELAEMAGHRVALARDWATIVNWVLMDGNGRTLGRWPEVAQEKKKADRGLRDYYLGAMGEYLDRGWTNYCLSATYRSEEDQLHKLGVSVVIPGNTSEKALGVLTAMVYTTSKALGSSFDIPNHETILISAQDPSTVTKAGQPGKARAAPAWIIYLHPLDSGVGTNSVEIPTDWVWRKQLTFYFDPARRRSLAERWVLWLGGLAHVPDPVSLVDRPAFGVSTSSPATRPGNPKFVILVQSRDWVVMFLIPGLMLSGFGLGLAAWRVWRAERRLIDEGSIAARSD